MMKKPFLLLSFVVAMLLTSCASTSVHNIVCNAEEQIVSTASAAISTGLQCSNVAQINADIQAIVNKVEMCTPAQGSHKKISPFICGLVGDLAVNQVGKAIPANWQCSPTAAKGTLKAIIVTACTAIPGL